MSSEVFKKVNYLCLGVVELQGEKKGIQFSVLDEEDKETSTTRCFMKKDYPKCFPGIIYTIESSETQMRGGTEWVGTWPDAERRTEIMVASRAVDDLFTARAQRKKAEKDQSDILECLAPIRKAYQKTNHAGRAAVLARAILYIQTGEK